MRRIGTLAAALLVVALWAPLAHAAPRPCPAGKLRVVVDGKRTCKPLRAGRAIRPTSSFQAQLAGALLGDPLIAVPRPRLDNGKRLAPAIRPALAVAARRAFTTAQSRAIDTAEAMAKEPGRRLAAATPGPRSTLAAPSVTVGPPRASGSVDAATGSGHVTIGYDATATSGDATVRLSVDFGIAVTQAEGATLGASLKTVATDGSGLEKTSIGRMSTSMPKGATCPDATGRIDWATNDRTSSTEGQMMRVGPARLGRVSTTNSSTVKIVARGQMDANAKLESITYQVDLTAEYAHSGQALAFFQSRARGKGTGKASGRLDPVTGAPLGGGSVTITTSATGDEVAATRAGLAAVVEQSLRELLGHVHKRMKDAEQNARSGQCTRVDVYPGGPVDLNPGETTGVSAKLLLTSGSGRATSVRWTATPAKGSVAPTATEGENPDFTITGAGPGPETASITFRAVSPAGISEGVWKGREALPEVLLARLSGVATNPFAAMVNRWSGTARLVRRADQGTATEARYEVASLTVTEFTGTIDAGPCVGTAPFSGTPATLNGGLDLLTAADGTRSYRLNLGWTATEGVLMTWVGMDCPAATPYGASGQAFTNDPAPTLPTSSRPFAGFPFDDSFTATDTAWSYATTAHVEVGT